MRLRGRTAALLVLGALGGLLIPSRAVEAQSADPVGVWNIRSRDMTDRATGGVRVVLLRVERKNGALAADITSIRNTFMPVDELRQENGALRVVHGSYIYTLNIDGDELMGTLESPLGTQQIEGIRQQQTLTYVGDEPDPFLTTRPGMLGHRTLLEPPEQEPDPHGWVRSRIDSVDDLALIVGRRAKVAIEFTNARAFERELLALAGRPVTVVGVWVGERLEIESIEPATP